MEFHYPWKNIFARACLQFGCHLFWFEHYKIDSTDDKKKDQQNTVKKKSSRKGPFSTGGIRLYKKCLERILYVLCPRLPSFFFIPYTFTFQLLDKPWSQVSSLLPPGSCLHFSSRIGCSNPTARRFFIECCYNNSRCLAFRKSICAQEKVPTNFYECALGGARTYETDPYQARG